MLQDLKDTLIPGTDLKDHGPGAVQGLHCRVRGVKRVFFLYYRTRAGQRRRPKLGEWPMLSLADARSRARAILRQVSAGKDPGGEWRKEREELTMDEMFQKTLAEHWSQARFNRADQRQPWAQQVAHLWKRHLLGEFGKLKMSEVTSARLTEFHRKFSKSRPTTANRLMGVLSKVFSHAEDAELRPRGSNPCAAVGWNPEKKRKRYATREELGRLGPILQRESTRHPKQVAFILTMMFTGARPSSLERARWDELQILQNGCGLLTRHGKTSTDTGEAEVIVFPEPAMHVISFLPKTDGRIFGIGVPKKWWSRIRKEADCPGLWVRDFRRTFSSVGLSGGTGLSLLGELLGHKSTQTTAIYGKLMDEARVETASGIAANVQKLLGQ